MESNHKSLFDVIQIGSLTLKNRFVRSSVSDHVSRGVYDAKTIDKYIALARGGVGTIITGYTLVDSVERNMGITAMYDESFIPAARMLTEAVHAFDTKIIMQLVYVGSGYNSQ